MLLSDFVAQMMLDSEHGICYNHDVEGDPRMTPLTSSTNNTEARKRFCTESIPAAARKTAKESHDKRHSELQEKRKALWVAHEPKVGVRYRVLNGRNEGSTGTLFWSGKTKWGTRYALALTDKKLPNGRYADVIFVRPRDVVTVNLERDQAAADLAVEISNLKVYENEVFETELMRLYEEAAKEWGVSLTVLLTRTTECINESVNRTVEYVRDSSETHWACDGRAYDQVARHLTALDREIKDARAVLAVIASRLA
jgi:hypothetical protein